MFYQVARSGDLNLASSLMRERLWRGLVIQLGELALAADLLNLLLAPQVDPGTTVDYRFYALFALQLADCYHALGQFDRAMRRLRSLYSREVPTWSGLNDEQRARARRLMAACAREMGDLDEANKLTESALQVWCSPREEAYILQEVVWIRLATGQMLSAIRHAWRARQLLANPGESADVAEILLMTVGIFKADWLWATCTRRMNKIAHELGYESYRQVALQMAATLEVRKFERARRRQRRWRWSLPWYLRDNAPQLSDIRNVLNDLLESARKRRSTPDEIHALGLMARCSSAVGNASRALEEVGEAVAACNRVQARHCTSD